VEIEIKETQQKPCNSEQSGALRPATRGFKQSNALNSAAETCTKANRPLQVYHRKKVFFSPLLLRYK